jgi:hypothetical protein
MNDRYTTGQLAREAAVPVSTVDDSARGGEGVFSFGCPEGNG